MRGVCDFTDFFVIATGRNPRQTKAIYDEVAGTLKKEQRLIPARERGLARGDVDRRRLQRRGAASLHARDAAVLPARGAVERRAVGRGRSARGLAAVVVADRPDVAHLVGWGFEHRGAGERGAKRPARLAHADATCRWLEPRIFRSAGEQRANELRDALSQVSATAVRYRLPPRNAHVGSVACVVRRLIYPCVWCLN